jgi:peptidoglycan/xylan/chitin deacetylase (PgdA/CDA1 family)
MQVRQYLRRLFGRQPAPVILMFHRVAEKACDPWALSVAPSRFEEQMRVLKNDRVPLSMREFVIRLENGTIPPRAVAVTFDDGYVDNLRVAKPIVEAFGIPATVFLTTGYLGKQKEFWWDELARLIFDCRGAVEGAIRIGPQTIPVRIPALRDNLAQTTWRAGQRPRTPRQHLYFEVWKELRVLDHRAREEGLEGVRQVFGWRPPSDTDLPMSPDDVRRLADGPYIDIGAHTETHQPLTTLALNERRAEIERSRAACEALTGKPVEGFAYPHGDLDGPTIDLVRESGFRWACSIRPAAADPSHFDAFELPRVAALNWSSTEMKRALKRVRRA